MNPANKMKTTGRLLSKGEKRRIPLFLFLLGLPYFMVDAQTVSDTTRTHPVVEKTPAGAVLRSLVIPGWGQWYNDQKLKAVIVFAGEAALVGNVVYYHQKAKNSTDPFEQAFFEDYKSQFIWYLVGAHLLSLLDAYVDANLWDFDTGPDLTKSKYLIDETPADWSLSLRLPLGRNRKSRGRTRRGRIERISYGWPLPAEASINHRSRMKNALESELFSQIVEDDHDKR